MIVVLKKHSAESSRLPIEGYLNANHISFRYVDALGVFVIPKNQQLNALEKFDGIETIIPIQTPYQLTSKSYKNKTSFAVNDIAIGENLFNVMAGPCSVENEDQIFATAEYLSSLGVKFLRGGAYKPRTSPYSFRGLETEGLKLLSKAAKAYNMSVVTEVLDGSLIDEVATYADVIQVGSRNMHNFHLLNQLGKTNKPILLKRGFQAKVVEWLLAAEYIMSGGNEQIILCERGIRSFDPSSRNVLDLGVVPIIKELSHLPIIIDPSHGTGLASRVTPASLAAAAIGADGVLIEVHPDPSKALSDSDQAISFDEFGTLLSKTKTLLAALGKQTDTETPVLNSGRL